MNRNLDDVVPPSSPSRRQPVQRSCQFRVNGTKIVGVIYVTAGGQSEDEIIRLARKIARRRSGDPTPEFIRFA